MKTSEIRILSKKNILCVYAVLAALMVIGTVADFQLNTALYHPASAFAQIVSHYGLYPAVLCTYVSLAIFLKLITRDVKDVVSILCGLWNLYMCRSATKEFIKLFNSDTGMVKYIQLGLGIAIAVICAAAVFVKLDTSDRRTCRRIAMTILFAFSFQYILINKGLKGLWGRPRFRTLIVTDGMEFTPWYCPGLTEGAKALIQSGISVKEFQSFPSGHAGCASCLITLVCLCRVVPSLKKRETLLTTIGICWALLTIIGRMVAGAHFLTDVTAATCIGWTGFVLFAKLFAIGHAGKE
ncbi:MAG: phosphatase PAP2 family protein [Lachnospiraceae bacterium]|nr:phosphatase PAP2 family protein [Lachnospiraceae bacterium]